MHYYHMTALNNLSSIAVQGLTPQNGDNGKLIGEEKVKKYYKDHQTEIIEYSNCDYICDLVRLKDFVDNFL